MPIYLKYNDPVKIMWRDGTINDPYVDCMEQQKIINGKIVLHEIPDEFSHVYIEGYKEVYQDTIGKVKVPDDNEYIVNYQNGVVTFNPSQENETITAVYKGRGMIQYPAERIYVHAPNPYAVENLQEFIEICYQKIGEVNTAIGDCKKATEECLVVIDEARNTITVMEAKITECDDVMQETIQAKDEAIVATDNAIEATEQALQAKEECILARNQSILVWKDPVPTYHSIIATYPEPEIGWTVITEEDGVVYRFTGAEWRPIGNIVGSVPIVSETTAGLLTPTDYLKLQDIEEGAEVNFRGEDAKEVLPDDIKTKTLVFVVPDEITNTGTQGILLQFPFDGEIVDVRGYCGSAGASETEISIEKISEQDFLDGLSWEDILSTKLKFLYGEKKDNREFEIINSTVLKSDLFRINITTVGLNIRDLVIQIDIKY